MGLATVTAANPSVSEAKKPAVAQQFEHNNLSKVKSAYTELMNTAGDGNIRSAAMSFVTELESFSENLQKSAYLIRKNVVRNKAVKKQALKDLKKLEDEVFPMLEAVKKKFGSNFELTEDETPFDILIKVGRYFTIAENIIEGVENPESVE